MEATMELRHLRYFVAVAEEGSLTVAAEKRLHTAQPSLRRQIRDPAYEARVPLPPQGAPGRSRRAAGRAPPRRGRRLHPPQPRLLPPPGGAAAPSKPAWPPGF